MRGVVLPMIVCGMIQSMAMMRRSEDVGELEIVGAEMRDQMGKGLELEIPSSDIIPN